MTVAELFEYVDEILENPFSDNIKRRWLNQIEAEIQVDVLLLAPDGIVKYNAEDNGAELIAPAPYDELYCEYLFWRICLAQHENELADNYAATFNRLYNEYVRFVCETINPGCGMAERMRYYLTAYQIAVKHGFTGSEKEWLDSLKGAEGKPGAGLHIVGYVGTEAELPVNPEQGTGYLVGEDNLLYIWDGTAWIYKQPLRGDPGYTPQKGVDYWTPEEEAEITGARDAANTAAENANNAANDATTAALKANEGATQATEAAAAANDAKKKALNAADYAHLEAENVSKLHWESVARLELQVSAAEAAAKASAESAANAERVSEGKVDSQQGAENAGKSLVIGPDGIVVPGEVQGNDADAVPIVEKLPGAPGENDPKAVYLLNDPEDQESGDLGELLAQKVDKAGWTSDMYLGTDADGNVVVRDAPSGGITEEDDPTVPDWAKQPEKPTYTAEEVGALPKDTEIPVVPSTLPNPNKLKFSGAVTGEYDGSKEVTVDIPASVPVPVAAEVGQVMRVSAVDENGKPTAWEPYSEGECELIETITLTENVATVSRREEPDGTAYNFERLIVEIKFSDQSPTAGTVTVQTLFVDNGWITSFGVGNAIAANSVRYVTCRVEKRNDVVESTVTDPGWLTTSKTALYMQPGVISAKGRNIGRFVVLAASSDVPIPAGSEFKIWAVRA